jgi:flagellar hook-basal body complex protein FliE
MTIAALSSLGSLITGASEGVTSTQSTGVAGAVRSTVQGPDFGSVLADVASQGMQTMRTGEATAISGMQGKASVQQVVEAVMSAEQTLQAAIAIRDKVVSAYQEISRMAM